jgi:sphingolipid delta-4 desaturase
LFLQFLFDREISLFNRILRRDRGKVAITDVSKPDMEMSVAPETKVTAEA